MPESSLEIISKAERMLESANSIQEAKELKDLMLTAADWAKRKGVGEEVVARARAYALRAERKMGEMLKATERARGNAGPGRGKAGTKVVPAFTSSPTLASMGVSKNESSRAQALAKLPRKTFEEVVEGKKTRTQVRREAIREKASKKAAALPEGKYRVIYADPPWKYGDTRDALSTATGATAHYPSMTIGELCALPIKELSADDSVLFLWTTSPLLEESFQVINAWGFTYKASFVWDKVKHNLGHYNSVRHEFLLICTRGSCMPDDPRLIDSVQSIERTKKHSEKPEGFRDIIDTLYTKGGKIELFARSSAKGWTSWGNQAPK